MRYYETAASPKEKASERATKLVLLHGVVRVHPAVFILCWQDDTGRDNKNEDDDCDKVTERKDDAAAAEPGRKQKRLARYC